MLQQNTAEGAVREPEIPNFEPQIPRDPIEAYASKLAPKSAQWLREHPDAIKAITLTVSQMDGVQAEEKVQGDNGLQAYASCGRESTASAI